VKRRVREKEKGNKMDAILGSKHYIVLKRNALVQIRMKTIKRKGIDADEACR
jgi:hypothetical protein